MYAANPAISSGIKTTYLHSKYECTMDQELDRTELLAGSRRMRMLYAAVGGFSECRADRDKTHGFYAINIVLAKLNSCRIGCLLCTKAEANVTKQTGITIDTFSTTQSMRSTIAVSR